MSGVCQIKPAKINLSLFGGLLGALEGADHVDLIEGAIGSEVDDKCKAKGKYHGEHVAQRFDLDVKVQRRHLQNVGKALGQQAAQRYAQCGSNRCKNQRLLVDVMVHLATAKASTLMVASSRSRSEIFVLDNVNTTTNDRHAAIKVTSTTTELMIVKFAS